MSRLKEIANQRWGAYTIAAVIGVLTFLFFANLPSVFSWLAAAINLMSPIIIGVVIAYLVDLIVVFFDRKVFKAIKNNKLRYVISVIVSILLVLALITLFFWFVFPELLSSVTEFISNGKNYASIIEENLAKLDEYAARYHIDLGASNWTASMYSEFDKFINEFTQNLSHAMDTVLGVGAVVANIFVGAILAVYFLAGKRRLFEGVAKFRHALLTDQQYKKHTAFLRRSSTVFSKYISYTLLEALGVGIVNAIFMLVAGLPNVTLISVVVGVTNILPTFGPIVGGIVGAFLLFLDDPFYALIFIIFTLILQTIDGYIIKPKMFGDTLGIPSVVSLISIIIGGKLFGPIGILLAIPFTAVLAILYHESLLPWLNKKKLENNREDKNVKTNTKTTAKNIAKNNAKNKA